MMSDSFLSSAGFYFLLAWSAAVTAVGAAAFGRDLFPSNSHSDRPSNAAPTPVDRSR
jgi:hypothetical protein